MESFIDIQISSVCLNCGTKFRTTDKVWRFVDNGKIVALCLDCHKKDTHATEGLQFNNSTKIGKVK